MFDILKMPDARFLQLSKWRVLQNEKSNIEDIWTQGKLDFTQKTHFLPRNCSKQALNQKNWLKCGLISDIVLRSFLDFLPRFGNRLWHNSLPGEVVLTDFSFRNRFRNTQPLKNEETVSPLEGSIIAISWVFNTFYLDLVIAHDIICNPERWF